MRVAVLPRETAASVITGSVSRLGWAFGAITLVLELPVLVEGFLRVGAGALLAAPVGLVVLQLAVLLWAAMRGTALPVVVYLAVGAVLAVVFQLLVRDALPASSEQLFLLNRPAVALVLVGVESGTTLVGLGWLAGGFLVSTATTAMVAVIAGVPFVSGWGPASILALGVLTYGGFDLVQRRSRRRLPNFDELEAETQALVDEAGMARRTAAVVHDTLLNDLAIVMNGPDRLDAHITQRLREDLHILTDPDWLVEEAVAAPVEEQDARMRNTMSRVVGDLQWRGLTIRLSGATEGVFRYPPELVSAIPDALHAALENVLRHSGTTVAELAVLPEPDAVTFMVTDHGVGFDQAAVPGDRLGVRGSIVRRIEDAGGSVRIWSAPGAGTSVVIRVPRESDRDDGPDRVDGPEVSDGRSS